MSTNSITDSASTAGIPEKKFTVIPQGTVPEFQPKKEKWNEYKERFENAVGLHGIKDKDMVRSLLINALPPETYRKVKIAAAPKKTMDLTLSQLYTLMNQIFEPERNNLVARLAIMETKQNQSEGIQEYVDRIREGIASCCLEEITDPKDVMLTIAFTRGLHNEEMKKAILQQHRIKANSSFMDTVNAAMGIELLKNNNQDYVNIVKKNSSFRNKNVVKCYCCGKLGHLKSNCRFKDKACNKCGRIGHLKTICKSKTKDVRVIEEDSESESETTSTYSNGIMNVANDRPMNSKMEVKLNGMRMNMMLDTGACQTLVNEQTWKEIGSPKIIENRETLRDYNGNKIDILGKAKIKFEYGKLKVKTKVTITKGNQQDIVGRDLINLLKIDLNKAYYKSENKEVIQMIGDESSLKEELKQKYPKLLAKGLGKYENETIKICIKENAIPKIISYRCSNLNLKEKVAEEINRLIELDVWEKVNTAEWISPMSIALKANGNIRICANFSQTINKVIISEKYQIPTVQEIFAKIANCKIFSNVDISDAFLAIVIDTNSRKYLTISTPLGLMRYKRLPFGLSSAPMVFQRIMNTLLQDLEGVAVYFDDIVIGGKDENQHDQRMHQVLSKLETTGFKINILKSKLKQREIKYLGHLINGDGIRADPEKIKAIKLMRKPENASEIKSFLGMILHYAKFIPNLSIISKPLNRLTQKNKKFVFDEECSNSFEKLKEILSSNQVLVPYSRNHQVVFASDASQFGFGAVILHRFEDNSERPVEFISKTFTSAQLNYSQLEKECCGIINGIMRFKDYLLGRSFILQTDCQPLKFILSPDSSLPNIILRRVDRWSCQLKRFNYTTEYVNTRAFGKADGLSRLPLREHMTMENNETENAVLQILEKTPINTNIIRDETLKDKEFTKIIRFIKTNWPEKIPKELTKYGKIRHSIIYKKGLLMKNELIMIPKTLTQQILELLHMGHTGVVRMKILARTNVYWCGINRQIEEWVRGCQTCMKIGLPVKKTELHPWIPSKRSFQRLHMDMCGPMEGKFFLVIYDTFTSYPFVFELKRTNTENIIHHLERIILDYGTPELIVTDNGRNFVSEQLKQFYKRHNIQFMNSAPYHPQSNGAAENLVKKFKISFYKSLEDGRSPRDAVRFFLSTNRNTPTTNTKLTPHEMMFNRVKKLIPDFPETVEKRKDLIEYKKNDKVWERTKMDKKWHEATIKEKKGTNLYKVIIHDKDDEEHMRHSNQLRKRRLNLSNVETPRRSERLSKKAKVSYKEMAQGRGM